MHLKIYSLPFKYFSLIGLSRIQSFIKNAYFSANANGHLLGKTWKYEDYFLDKHLTLRHCHFFGLPISIYLSLDWQNKNEIPVSYFWKKSAPTWTNVGRLQDVLLKWVGSLDLNANAESLKHTLTHNAQTITFSCKDGSLRFLNNGEPSKTNGLLGNIFHFYINED